MPNKGMNFSLINKYMLSRKRINEIAEILANNINHKEEDAEESLTPGTTTPTGSNVNQQNTQELISTTPEEKEQETDPLVDQVIKLVQQYKDKQVSDAQMDYAYRQDQANKIVNDIEKFIKDNTKK